MAGARVIMGMIDHVTDVHESRSLLLKDLRTAVSSLRQDISMYDTHIMKRIDAKCLDIEKEKKSQTRRTARVKFCAQFVTPSASSFFWV